MGWSGDGKRNILWGWPKVAKNSVSGVGKGNVTRNVSNYADFMVRRPHKIYTVFHVSGCSSSGLPFIMSSWF